MGALTRNPGTVGDRGTTPVAPMGNNPGAFKHTGGNGPSASPSRFGGGYTTPAFADIAAGLRAAAAQTPSPNEPETVVDFYTAPVGQHAKINRVYPHPLMASPQKDLLIFTERERGDPIGAQTGSESRRYSQVSICAFNWILAASSRQPATPADVMSAYEAVLDSFGYEGIVTTESGESTQHIQRHAHPERTFNVRNAGLASTPNVWGNRVRAGTNLFVIIKKEPISGARIRVIPQGAFIPLPTGAIATHPFQVSFFGDYRYEKPPMSALRYTDEFGMEHLGIAIRVAKASNNPPCHVNADHLENARHDISSMLALNKIAVHVTFTG